MSTKYCPKCESEKDIEDFNKKGPTRRQPWCSECTRTYAQDHYRKNRQYYKEKAADRKAKTLAILRLAKSHVGMCLLCTENELVCLDLHHLDPTKKTIHPGHMARDGWAPKRIFQELDNCMVVCSNCHKKIHAGLITQEALTKAIALQQLSGWTQETEKTLVFSERDRESLVISTINEIFILLRDRELCFQNMIENPNPRDFMTNGQHLKNAILLFREAEYHIRRIKPYLSEADQEFMYALWSAIIEKEEGPIPDFPSDLIF